MNKTNHYSIAAAIFACALASANAQDQTKSVGDPNWNPPRTSDGQPDIQGSWTGSPNGGGGGAAYDFELGTPVEERIVSGGAPNPNRPPQKPPAVIEGGKIPYQPWAQAVREDNYRRNMNPTSLDDLDSHSRCLQMGVPRQHFLGAFRIVQAPGYVLIYENSSTRVIPLDGRPHIASNIKLWAGDSVGHWEGNTLVVDVTNINDSGWYDWGGNFHSDDLHLVERWTFKDAGTLSYEAMNYDPRVLTRPWKLKNEYVRNKNANVNAAAGEDNCYEGEKDIQVMLFQGKQNAETTQKK